MKTYEHEIKQVDPNAVISCLRKLHCIQTLLGFTWLGRDGWGDCGELLWGSIVPESNKSGNPPSEHPDFEEEVLHRLRHTMPLDRSVLARLPEKLDLELQQFNARDTDVYNQAINKLEANITALALVRSGVIYEEETYLRVSTPMYAAACYNSANIARPDDRAVYTLLQDHEVPNQNDISLIPNLAGRRIVSADVFWLALDRMYEHNNIDKEL